MIGILKPAKMELVLKDYQYYKMYYCSICRHLVRNNIRIYSFLTGYEGTLMAIVEKKTLMNLIFAPNAVNLFVQVKKSSNIGNLSIPPNISNSHLPFTGTNPT